MEISERIEVIFPHSKHNLWPLKSLHYYVYINTLIGLMVLSLLLLCKAVLMHGAVWLLDAAMKAIVPVTVWRYIGPSLLFTWREKKQEARIRNSRKAKRGTEHQRAEEMRVEKAGGPVSDSMETNDPPEQEGIVQVLPSTFSSFCDARGFHMQIALDAEACVRAPCPPDYREGGVFTPHPFFSENCPSTPQLSTHSLSKWRKPCLRAEELR